MYSLVGENQVLDFGICDDENSQELLSKSKDPKDVA